MQVVVLTECKSCEISNQIFSNGMFPFSKTKGFHFQKQKKELVMT